MDKQFRDYVELLDPLFEQLMRMDPVKVGGLPHNMPAAGIYLCSEKEKHLYVGRSNRMRARLQEHCRPSSTHNSAPFAFTLARKATGQSKASYLPSGSRKELEKEPVFKEAFDHAKTRVRRMDIRYVGEADPTRQALLEMYVAIALGTPHNDFGTH